jgi:hypothetical protein
MTRRHGSLLGLRGKNARVDGRELGRSDTSSTEKTSNSDQAGNECGKLNDDSERHHVAVSVVHSGDVSYAKMDR